MRESILPHLQKITQKPGEIKTRHQTWAQNHQPPQHFWMFESIFILTFPPTLGCPSNPQPGASKCLGTKQPGSLAFYLTSFVAHETGRSFTELSAFDPEKKNGSNPSPGGTETPETSHFWHLENLDGWNTIRLPFWVANGLFSGAKMLLVSGWGLMFVVRTVRMDGFQWMAFSGGRWMSGMLNRPGDVCATFVINPRPLSL